MLLKNDVRTLSLSQAPAVIQLLLASLLAHRLSEIDYGTFNYLKNIAIMGYAFVSFSFERTALNLQASYSLKTITCNIIPIRMIMFFLLAIPIVIYTLVSGVLPILVALTAASLIPAIFDIKYSFDIKQTVHKDIYLALFRAAPLLLLIPLLLFSTSGTTILTAHFALLLSGYSLYVFLQHGHVPGLIGKLELKNSKLFFQLSAFVFLGSIASNLNIYVSTLIIEARIGLSELATYSVALTIYLGLLSVFSLIVRISVSQYLGNDQFKREFFTCMKKIMPIWFVFSLAIIMYGKTLIEFVFGTNYSQSYSTLLVMLGALLIAPTSMFFNNILIAKGFTRSYMLISLLALGVNLAVIMLLVNHLGIISAASGMTLGLLTSSLISGRIAMKASSVSS